MVAVSSVSSPAVTALKLITAQASNGSGKVQSMPSLNPIPAHSLSPNVSDTLLKIAETIKKQPTRAAFDRVGYERGPLSKLSDLPPSHAEKLRALGADAAVKVTATELSDESFHAMVLKYGKENWSGLAGFNEALANGTLKIQRASDVPELGLGNVQYDLYKDGNMIGGAGFASGTFDKSLYLDIQEQGIRQATGSINGRDYYVTWSDPSLAKAA